MRGLPIDHAVACPLPPRRPPYEPADMSGKSAKLHLHRMPGRPVVLVSLYNRVACARYRSACADTGGPLLQPHIGKVKLAFHTGQVVTACQVRAQLHPKRADCDPAARYPQHLPRSTGGLPTTSKRGDCCTCPSAELHCRTSGCMGNGSAAHYG